MTELEKDIERKVLLRVEACGGRCLKWVCPGWAGVPDRIVLLPGGRCLFVETKRPKGGRLSKLQEKWREWLTALGFTYWVIWNEEDLLVFARYLERVTLPKERRTCRNCEYDDNRAIDEPCSICERCSLWEAKRGSTK